MLTIIGVNYALCNNTFEIVFINIIELDYLQGAGFHSWVSLLFALLASSLTASF